MPRSQNLKINTYEMAYNENLAARVREALAGLPAVAEKKMFGGLAFMVDDKMCITIGEDRIMCRIDPDTQEQALAKPGVGPVQMGGRLYKGYVHVMETAIKSKPAFDYWIRTALDFNKLAKSSRKK